MWLKVISGWVAFMILVAALVRKFEFVTPDLGNRTQAFIIIAIIALVPGLHSIHIFCSMIINSTFRKETRMPSWPSFHLRWLCWTQSSTSYQRSTTITTTIIIITTTMTIITTTWTQTWTMSWAWILGEALSPRRLSIICSPTTIPHVAPKTRWGHVSFPA